jgi:RNA polymerase sigma-70 factor (ECF subfamily)
MDALPAPVPTPVVGDAELARQIRRGNHSAFKGLMRQFNRRLYRTARAILKDDAAAEDVLQDAYVAIYRNIGDFRGEAGLSTWLTRIVVNQALQVLRATRRQAVVIPMESLRDSDWHAIGTTMNHSQPDTPEDAALRAEMRRLLERKIDALPDAFRTVFVLREVEELSVEETAACLDIPEATVRTRLFRAKARLRESIAREIDVAAQNAFEFAGARCDRIVANVLARIGQEPHPED